MEIESTGLVHILLVVAPGFMMLKGAGYKAASFFDCLMLSAFWGIAAFGGMKLWSEVTNWPEAIVSAIEYPYVGVLVLSVLAYIAGLAFKKYIKKD